MYKVNSNRTYWAFFLFMLAVVIAVSPSIDVFASATGGSTTNTTANVDPTGVVKIFCNVIKQVTGGIGKVISILILISLAIGLFIGKISWGLAIATMTGMGLLFGAEKVVNVISAKKGEKASDVSICDEI